MNTIKLTNEETVVLYELVNNSHMTFARGYLARFENMNLAIENDVREKLGRPNADVYRITNKLFAKLGELL